MDDFSGDLFCNGNDGGVGLRYRGINGVAKNHSSFTTTTYSDESGLSASIEYVSDGNGNEAIPVFVTKAGNKVFIPPSIADLLRDKPPETSFGSDCEDEEAGDAKSMLMRPDYDFDDSDTNDSDETLKFRKRHNRFTDEDLDSDEELDGIQVVSGMRKVSKSSDDFDEYNDLFSSIWEQFKNVGPKLVPFLKTLGLYFVIFVPEDRPSLFAMTLKCLPIVSLALFIVLHGIGLTEEHKFSRRILTGLVFSCLGDAFLIWPSYFLHGMAAFGIAQCFYIRAFGFQPLNWKLGIAIYISTSSSLILILPGLMADAAPIAIGVLVYSFLLTTMLWRAIARVEFSESLTWSQLSSCFGAISFVISDTILALNQFYTSVPHHQTLIMATYYIGQLGIALSVVSRKEQELKLDEMLDKNASSLQTSDEALSGESVRLRKNKLAI